MHLFPFILLKYLLEYLYILALNQQMSSGGARFGSKADQIAKF
jgi:hypothetical protein